eukprot:924757-Prymnesium_polylepis.2
MEHLVSHATEERFEARAAWVYAKRVRASRAGTKPMNAFACDRVTFLRWPMADDVADGRCCGRWPMLSPKA